MQKPLTVGLTTRSDLEGRDRIVHKIAHIVQKTGHTLLLDEKRCMFQDIKAKSFSSLKHLDVLIAVGGDGTILRVIREMENMQVPIISVNRGTVGFLTEVHFSEVDRVIPLLLQGEGMQDKRGMLSVRALRGKKVIWQGKVLNEAVINQGAISRLIDLKTEVNNDPLTSFHADGLIIATPTGSTAYSLSAGGPIVHPQLSACILTPINPHSFTQKPLVIPGDQTVKTTIMTKNNKFADVQISLTLDGQTYISLKRGDVVEAKMSDQSVTFLRRREDTFYETLRAKLKWGETLE